MAKGGKDGKPRGRMSAYAYFVQTCREDHKKTHPSENVVFAEFSKSCAERWKNMTDKDKSRYQLMSDKDKKRYESEMSAYIPPKGAPGKKRKRTKDPNAPKRALSGFFWFCQDERPKVREINPDHTVGEVAKELGKRWNVLGQELKSKYATLAAKDKARYDKEMAVYKNKKPKIASPTKGAAVAAHHDYDDDDEDEEEDDDEDDDE